MLNSNSNSLTELGDPEITPSLEPSSSFSPQASSSIPQASNFSLQAPVRCMPWSIEKIDYQKSHTGQTTMTKTNSSVPYNPVKPSEIMF